MTSQAKKLKAWFFQGMKGPVGVSAHQQDHWWRVMCLTGVDYFSSMGFQPGISFLAAGVLSPLATLYLVFLTLFGALPAYWLVARESPHGQGSFAIFERIFSGWKGKTFVLVLLGFAATDFIFTITMCAADATAHVVQNPLVLLPWVPSLFHDRMFVTLVLIAVLGAVFLKGFDEAIRISFWLVVIYLAVNVVVLYVCVDRIIAQPDLIASWLSQVDKQYPSTVEMLKKAALVFPQLALGMSGFETGVAVMPLIRSGDDPALSLSNRIRNTRLLLVTVAVMMSVFLVIGSLVTTILIPAALYEENGAANGRALAYLAHLYMGPHFGTVYDISTILILWFAGASGMAALLTLVPQYLPRYGMAPSWAAARRPLVVFFIAVSFWITYLFKAKVDPQAGAFATGLLVMITSAVVAITLVVWNQGLKKRFVFSLISAAFVYASVTIIRDRPDGLVIALLFVAAVLLSSIVSRAVRSTELRIGDVRLDEIAARFVDESGQEHLGQIRLLAHRPSHSDYLEKEMEARRNHHIEDPDGNFIFLEVSPASVSDFLDDHLDISGYEENGYQILRCASPSVPNAIAATLLHIRDQTGKIPHGYFGWTEGNPLFYILKYVLLGEGETAPVTREILRCAEPDPQNRPKIHVA